MFILLSLPLHGEYIYFSVQCNGLYFVNKILLVSLRQIFSVFLAYGSEISRLDLLDLKLKNNPFSVSIFRLWRTNLQKRKTDNPQDIACVDSSPDLYKGPTPPSPPPSLPSPLPHRDKVNSLCPGRGGRGRGGELFLPPPPPSFFVQNNLEISSDMKSA